MKQAATIQQWAVGGGRRRGFTRAGFTLVELMVSVAIVVFLMIGINHVFRMTSDTVAHGQANSGVMRDLKAAATVIENDWNSRAPDGPVMMIFSAPQKAFLDAADQAAGPDPANPLTYDPTQSGTPLAVQAFNYNQRNHRADMLGFFARGLFSRQTGVGTNLLTAMNANEAWVWYGHASLSDNQSPSGYWLPGTGTAQTNPNNFFAVQFVLSRQAISLSDNVDTANNGSSNSNDQGYLTGANPASVDQRVRMAPLAGDAAAFPAVPAFMTLNSRYDVGKSSIDTYRKTVLAEMTHDLGVGVYADEPADPLGLTQNPWWQSFLYRFQCSPYIGTTPTAASLAQAVPYFLGGTTQFTVEYAGDYLSQYNDPSQPNYGQIRVDPTTSQLIDAPDGQIDFIVDKSADSGYSAGNPVTPTTWVKRTRWYGLPRNVNLVDDMRFNGGQPLIRGRGFVATAADHLNDLWDVVPLATVRDVIGFNDPNPAIGPKALFERKLPVDPNVAATPGQKFPANYADPAVVPTNAYFCAWGPRDLQPKMLRITIQATDAQSRLAEGQAYEFVLGRP